MPYNNLMSNTAMTTPTPLAQGTARNTRPTMSNTRLPRQARAASTGIKKLPNSVLAKAQQIRQQRAVSQPLAQTMPKNTMVPAMNTVPLPPQQTSLAPVESVPTNPITGQMMSPEDYQAQFGSIAPPTNNINYFSSLMAPPTLQPPVNNLTGQPMDPTQTNQLNFLHSLPMESAQNYFNPLTGQPMTQEEYQQMLNQQMLAPGYSMNQLMPQQQIAGVQAVQSQPKIF